MTKKVTRGAAATAPTAATAATAEEGVKARLAPRLGESIQVQVDEGVVLINNETGAPFASGVPTPVTVTLTVLRRLQDGDFRQVD